MKLETKVTLCIGLILIPVLFIAAMLSIHQDRQDILDAVGWRALALSEPIQKRAASLASYPQEMQRTLGLNVDCQTLLEENRDKELIQVGVMDPSGQIIAHTDPQKIGTQALLENNGKILSQTEIQTALNPSAFSALIPFHSHPNDPAAGFIKLSFSRESINKKIQGTLLSSAAIFFAFLTLSFLLISGLLKKVLTNPIAQLCRAVSDLAEGQAPSHVAASGSEEIRLLADSFNHMQNQIHQQIQSLNHAISERHRAEKELQNSNENLRITLNSIGDAVIATDACGYITRMNPVAETLTGWKLNDAQGKPLPEVFNIINALTREPVESPVEKVLETGKIVGLANHTALLTNNGTEHQIADSGAPIRDHENNIIGVVLVFRDVTEEYALQERLRQSQKMEAIGQLAGGVAHDFNNMLGGIMGAAELLEKDLPDSPSSKKFHGIILDSAKRAADLTSKLLAFARKQQTAASVIDIHQIIQEAIDLVKTSIDPRIHFDIDLCAETSNVIGDPSHLQSAIMNLAINSSHAMPQGGTIYVSSQLLDLDNAYCVNSLFDIEPGPFIKIEVRDTGHGIPPEDLPRIFEPFFTTRGQGKGTGLGLAAVYGTVQQHHGAIAAYSEIGSGTSFHIYLPLTGESATQRRPESTAISGSGTILLVDDEPVMRTTASAILETLGYTVEAAENGASGLDLFTASPGKYDLVLLDMIMPVMSGKECFDGMRKIDPNVRVVLASGFTKEDDIVEMKEQGLRGFINKPFRRHELSQIIHDVLTDSPSTKHAS